MNMVLALYLCCTLFFTTINLIVFFLFKSTLIFPFNYTKQQFSFFGLAPVGSLFNNGFSPFWFDKRHLRSARDLFSYQLSNVGVGMRAVYIYNILILILLCSWISSTGILPVVSGFISYI